MPTKKIAVPTPIVAPAPAKPVSMLVKYRHPNLKISPRKLRLVASSAKKLLPAEAISRLRFTNSSAARILTKAIQSAIADAKNNHHLSPSSLTFNTIMVDEGQKIKRMDKSHGSRFARGIRVKRHSRLTIILSGTISSQ